MEGMSGRKRRSGPTAGTWRLAAGALGGALVALLLVLAFGFPGGNAAGPGLTGNADEPAPTPAAFDAPAGSCLTWTKKDASDVQKVTCAQPHLFEVTGLADLTPQFRAEAPFPTDEQWRQIVQERCLPLSTAYLPGGLDPVGRFSVGAIKPSEGSWRQGDRMLRCGLQTVGRSGGLFLSEGPAASQEQADVHQPGTCLASDGVGVGDPIDCMRTHAVEVVGVVDLGPTFPNGFPDEAAQDGALAPACTRLAADYAGGPQVVGEKRLTVFWENLSPESWAAGTTQVDCRLGAFLPDRSGFAPVTGTVRGGVIIGSVASPPAPATVGPVPSTAPRPAPANVTAAPAPPNSPPESPSESPSTSTSPSR